MLISGTAVSLKWLQTPNCFWQKTSLCPSQPAAPQTHIWKHTLTGVHQVVPGTPGRRALCAPVWLKVTLKSHTTCLFADMDEPSLSFCWEILYVVSCMLNRGSKNKQMHRELQVNNNNNSALRPITNVINRTCSRPFFRFMKYLGGWSAESLSYCRRELGEIFCVLETSDIIS